MGYGSTYEQDLVISIEKGVVTETNVRHDGTSGNRDAPEVYGIGTMTVFPKKKPGGENES